MQKTISTRDHQNLNIWLSFLTMTSLIASGYIYIYIYSLVTLLIKVITQVIQVKGKENFHYKSMTTMNALCISVRLP